MGRRSKTQREMVRLHKKLDRRKLLKQATKKTYVKPATVAGAAGDE